MGSSRVRNSTRAKAARSVPTVPTTPKQLLDDPALRNIRKQLVSNSSRAPKRRPQHKRRKAKAPKPTAPHGRPPTPADKWASIALFDLLQDICIIESLLSVTVRSLEQQEVCGDEHDALRLAIKMLRQSDNKLNDVADKIDESEPVTTTDLIRAGAFDDEDDDGGVI